MASCGSDRNMSEETFDYICTACDEDNVIKEGIKYCVECKGYCCNVCLSAHKKYPTLREHNLLDISTSQQTDQTSKLPSFPTERCSIHQGKVIDMYCGDHDAVGCYACIAIDHKNCTDIHSIPDDVDKITKDGEFDKTCEDLQKMTEKLQSMLKNSNASYLANLENSRQNSLLAILEHRRETDAILDRLEEDAKSEIESMYSQLKSKLLKDNEIIKSCLNKCVELAERNKRGDGNKSQKFVYTKQVSSTIKNDQYDIYNAEKELKDFERENILSFVADKSLIEFLQQLEKFGRVKATDTSTLYRTKQCQNIVVKIPSDNKKCKITGCCILPGNELIITDNANKKLKRVDIANVSVLDCIDMPYDIYGVCRVQNNEIAVACNSDKMIQFVSVGLTMTTLHQVKLNHKCYHVAYMDNKLYVSDDSGRSVYIYDMVGTLLQTISKDSKGNKLFEYSEQIALCDSEDYMFVGGYRTGLVYLDKKGNHIATVKDTDIAEVEGVCVDGRGNVFVAGRAVVQLRYDGTKIGVITKEEDGVRSPLALCFHRQLCKLFVTMSSNDKIKMLELV